MAAHEKPVKGVEPGGCVTVVVAVAVLAQVALRVVRVGR